MTYNTAEFCTTTKPATHNADLNHLPSALTPLIQEKRWVVWKWEQRKNGKWTKPPYQAAPPNKLANTKDQSTWGSYEQALVAFNAGGWDGIGFVLTGHDRITALDLDKCLNADWAKELIRKSNSYVEVTPSGKGLRIIGTGTGQPIHKSLNMSGGGRVELYRKATPRYITVTGSQYGEGSALADIDHVLDDLLRGKRTDEPIRLKWHGVDEYKAPNWLVRDLIPEKTLDLLVGESQAGKSFIAVHMAVCLGTGTAFFTKNVKSGGTVYIASEAAETVTQRLIAAHRAKLPIAMISSPPDLMTKEGVELLIKTLLEVSNEMERQFSVPLRLVIIDTMLATFGLENWNDPAQCNQMFQALLQIVNNTGANILGVHHHGKDISRGAAGSYALTAAPDVHLAVFKEDDGRGNVIRRTIAITKNRQGETGWGCDFQIRGELIGTDDEGEDCWSAVVQEDPETAGRAIHIQKRRKDRTYTTEFRLAVTRCLSGCGGNSVHKNVVRKEFDGIWNKSDDANRKAFKRGLEAALDSAWLKEDGENLLLA